MLAMTLFSLSATLRARKDRMGGQRASEGSKMLLEFLQWAAARFRREEGATMVEYGLLVVLIAIVVSVGAALLGNNLNALFNRVADCVANGGPC